MMKCCWIMGGTAVLLGGVKSVGVEQSMVHILLL